VKALADTVQRLTTEERDWQFRLTQARKTLTGLADPTAAKAVVAAVRTKASERATGGLARRPARDTHA